MTDDVRDIVLGVVAALACGALGWFARTALWRRALRRKQAFFGLPEHAEALAVVGREPGGDASVHRHDVFALLELSAVAKECGAHTRLVAHDATQQGFGERTEFCVGGPSVNRRTAAHLASMLPGVRIEADPEQGPDRGSFRIGTDFYRVQPGVAEHVLLARLTGGQGARPVFVFCGQRPIAHQAAARYLARHHERLQRKHGDGPFCLLLKVVNSQAYGPDVAEFVADVTKAAREPAPAGTQRPSHRAGEKS
ncbi:hypothetical protein [Streptomyces fuscigenes]|uniref:hypothetical protein n=1 Tax=Streptomyces fuscigenes TaxID=1528880 RepID=UPI001F3D546A|nr:hypothetical protein [Streptomyces fuscigenes]MCF3960082.1 hypothetical protein [Streptomyces fuscigenes]